MSLANGLSIVFTFSISHLLVLLILAIVSFVYFLFICFGCAGFLWLHGLFSSCGARASHCGGFSCYGAQVLGCVGSVVAVPGL